MHQMVSWKERWKTREEGGGRKVEKRSVNDVVCGGGGNGVEKKRNMKRGII